METCVYCGSPKNITKDHIPPKNLFPKPRPNNLITVPACIECHSSTSKDDEYFRQTLCMSDKVGNDPDAKANREPIIRSLSRPQARGMRRSFASNIFPVQFRTYNGAYLGERLAFNVNLERIYRVVERMVRGLFFYETNRTLDPNYGVRVFSDDTLRENSKEVIEEMQQTILIPLAQS